MKKIVVTFLSMMFTLSVLTSCSTKTVEEPKGVHKAKTVAVMATVESINLEDRTVVLKEDSGEIETISVSEEIKNLETLKVGDRVITVYQEAVALRLAKEGDITLSDTVVTKTDETQAKPAAAKVKVKTVIATIIGIDLNAQTATLKGPEGNVRDVYVEDVEKLKKVKLGDKIHVTYTESVAVSVIVQDD